ncbi:MAG TPA: hypothetical protein VGN80_09640 [Devosiaceae bacterium]|jgi:hypothetical protein|nr:hypothetical protein [Devosiaceae bacterium]
MVLALLMSVSPVAQAQEIEWREVTALAKGVGTPSGAEIDILGIAPGDTFAEAKEKLLALAPPDATQAPELSEAARRAGVVSSPAYEEETVIITLPTGGSSRIEAEYASRMSLTRRYGEEDSTSDRVQVDFSAPASGHQAMMIMRTITYNHEGEQPLINPIIEDLSRKFGAQPSVFPDTGDYIWRFDDGSAVPVGHQSECHHEASADTEEHGVAGINEDGRCDVLLTLAITRGISEDHAEQLRFYLSDNERAKANLSTDYGFFHDYVEEVRSRAGDKPAL